MKKVIIVLISIISLITIFTFNVSANEIVNDNLINDESTISDDFELLEMDINEYYIPEKYDYQKWYVVAMAETYTDDNDIQTYLYLYNPTAYNESFPKLTFTYLINSKKKTFETYECLQVDYSRSLYKIKGFVYEYSQSSIIEITNIHHYLWIGEDPMNTGADLVEDYDSLSTFKATNSHSLVDNKINIELNFNSTIILEEYTSVAILIDTESNERWAWDIFKEDTENELYLYFYNFNFPKRFQNTDWVFQAVFAYDYQNEYFKYKKDSVFNGVYSQIVDSKVIITKEVETFVEDTKNYSYTIGGKTETLSFPRFYLGDRYADKQFGDLDLGGYSKSFDYDCSVFLHAEYLTRKYSGFLNEYMETNAMAMNNIEMIEIHFRCDGILYSCQVVSKPVNPDIVAPNLPVKKEWWKLFWDWLINNLPYSALRCVAVIIFAPLIITFVFNLIKGFIISLWELLFRRKKE